MGRGERAVSKNDGKGQALKRNMKSDDSDEEYMVEEDEADDLSDELESLCGDASDEESLGSFEDEEEEEIVGNFVKSKSRKRSMGRKKNGIKKSSKKRKRVANDEEDDDEDYHEDDDGGGARSVGRMKISKRSKGRKTIAYDEEEDDEEYHEEDDDSGGERSIGRMKNGISKRSKGRKRIVYQEDDDDDDDEYHEEEDGGGGGVERSMAQIEKGIRKSSKERKRIAYHEEEEEEEEEDDDDEDYDEDDGGGFGERSIGRMKKSISRSVKTRQRITYDEEEDDEDCHEEDGGGGERCTGQMNNGINRSSKKRKRIACDDEDYHEEDEDGGGDDNDDDDDDYDDDGEADDDEFTPDELDFFEEEELSSSRWKNKKKGRHLIKKKGSGISRKRKTGGKLLKKHGKKKRKGSSRSRKSTSGKSRKSMDKVLSSRTQRKRVPAHRKKKAMPCSDSDFISSESSDYEFTISEEEREQVREANEFCMRRNSNLRSSKTDQENAAAYNQLRNLPRRKGKEKVEEIKSDVGKQVCGICLTEEGKNTVRGTLNCCSHFFCFACIIEWSKVESRCPLCKQRFLTISKPGRSATRIDLRDVVINVPERDQVYQPSEEELRNYLDPYENVICTECHEGGDDALMLLCDLCDSPAHTYCVGLGREVPEGNWYCEGCKPSALGFTSAQAQDLTPAQRANISASNEPSSFENMAEIDLNITIPETPMTPVNGFLVSPRQPLCGGLQPPAPVSGVGVSTLSGRRRVHRYLLSSNRVSHMAMRVDRTTSDRMTNFSGSWGERAAQSSFIDTGATDVGPSYHAEYMDRLQENPSVPAQNRESFSGRLNLMRGQVLQVPSAADGSSYGCMQLGGVGEINLGLNCMPGREYLRPCTSSLNMGSGTNATPLYNRDVDQNAARQQIQSMVKSQLKNLCRDMELGHDTLKQIARSSTHTILAVCGLEHSRSEAYEVQPPICLHNEAPIGPQTSLMKGCCQACFDSFVRDVVRMIMEARAPQQLGFRNY